MLHSKNLPAMVLLALSFPLIFPTTATGQTRGAILGRVTDRENNEPLQGALVTALGHPGVEHTDGNGEYRILNLSPGVYRIKVSLIGYVETTVEGIWVRAGRDYVQDVALVASPLELEGMVVEASRVPILQPDITETRQTVSEEEIRELPVDDLEDIIELQAGVVHGTIRGGRMGQEVYVIDGVTMKNFLEGSQEGLGLDMGVLSIQELALISNGFSAEYGQALSGVVNLVTKEGGTSHEGAVRATTDAPMPEGDEYGYSRLEVASGGPLDPGARFRYFFSFDGKGMMDADPVSVGLEKSDGSVLARLPHNEGDDLNIFGKITSWATKSTKISASLLASREQQRFFDPHYKYNLENTLSQKTTAKLFNVSLSRITAASSARASILDARFSLYRSERYLGVLEGGYFDTRNEIFGFSLSDYQFRGEDFVSRDPRDQLSAGGAVPGYEVPAATGQNAYGVQDTSVFVDAGQNPVIIRTLYEFFDVGVDWDNRFEKDFALKTGMELKLNHTQAYQRLAAYQPGGVPNYVEFYPVLGASYVQSQLTAPGLVLDLGLRFDMFLPRIDYPENYSFPTLGLRSSENKFALNPRLGTSIMLGEKDLLRVNYGVFRQTPDFQYLFDVAFSDPLRAGKRRRGNPELQFERTTQYEVSYSRALTEDISVTAGVYVKQLENLVASRPTNLTDPQLARFMNDDFGSVRGFELLVKKRMGSSLGGTMSYTYQEAKGMVSSAFDLFSNVVYDPESRYIVDLGTKEFPLDFDQRHTINLAVEGRLPGGLGGAHPLLSPFADLALYSTIEYGSGLPYTKTKIDTTLAGGALTETLIPAGEPNSSRLGATMEWDMRASRSVNLGGRDFTFFADIRNLLGRKDVIYYDPWTSEPWSSPARLRTLAREATEDAITLPAESADYSYQADANGDMLLTREEQEEAYYRALVDRYTPVLIYNEPRQVRFGVDMRF